MARPTDISASWKKVTENPDQKGGPKKSAGNPLIFEQIESTADYYSPGLYARLLSYYSNLSLQADPLANQFVPLSPSTKKGGKQFIIGVLPPTANVTGRLLDRSASVAAIQGIIPDVEGSGGRIEDIQPPAPGVPTKSEFKKNWGLAGGASDLGDEFWLDYVAMCERLKVDPVELAAVIYTESGFNPSAAGKSGETSVAKGLVQNIKGTMVPSLMTAKQWEDFDKLSGTDQLYFTEKFLVRLQPANKKRVALHQALFGKGYIDSNPNGELYATLEYQERSIRNRRDAILEQIDKGLISPEDGNKQIAALKFKDPSKQDEVFKLNYGLDRNGDGAIHLSDFEGLDTGPSGDILEAIAAAQAAGENGTFGAIGNPFENADGVRKRWVDDGSPAAAAIREQLYKISRTGLNATGLGQQFQAAQKAQIQATQAALEKMRNTPPLRMLVNPKSFSVRGEKITSDGNWGRNGPIIEHWGNNQDKISGSGSVAGFYALDSLNANGPGLTRMVRNFSLSYQNFLSLYLLYRNNAGLYLPDFGSQDKSLNLSLLGSIYIYYDHILYIGSFDSLNITEDDTKPFSLDYSFEFTVRAAFLLDHPSEQGFTYGKPGLFTVSSPALEANKVEKGTSTILSETSAIPDPEVLVDASPQIPGNEPGARKTEAEIQAELNQLRQDYLAGVVSEKLFLTRSAELRAELEMVTYGA
jgi:hypothetical protein